MFLLSVFTFLLVQISHRGGEKSRLWWRRPQGRGETKTMCRKRNQSQEEEMSGRFPLCQLCLCPRVEDARRNVRPLRDLPAGLHPPPPCILPNLPLPLPTSVPVSPLWERLLGETSAGSSLGCWPQTGGELFAKNKSHHRGKTDGAGKEGHF